MSEPLQIVEETDDVRNELDPVNETFISRVRNYFVGSYRTETVRKVVELVG